MGTMQDCGPMTRELIARLTTPSRNRYYYGKLLDTYHLDLEQRYGNSKRWMLNRLSLGAGVLCGLHVRISNDRKLVRVGSGVAIDGWGREIVVSSSSPGIDPRQPTDECGRPAGDPVRRGGTVTLYVCYHECEAEPSPALVSECDERACENGIVREKFRLQIRAGLPDPPADITDAQCTSIFGTLPPNTTRRIVACGTLDPTCDAPDDPCIPIATILLDERGLVASVDECSYRTTVYSNAVLLDLIFCLAARVDVCCGETAVKSLAIVSGEPQGGTAGQPLAQPLVTQVTEGAASVPNEPVTFKVLTGGGAVGDTAATLAASFTVDTDAGGVAVCPIWRAGSAPGTQQVTAQIASGTPSLVVFHATVEPSEEKPPVVVAVWPPPGALLSSARPDPEKTWTSIWIKRKSLQITFDRAMRSADLSNPDAWLRLFVLHHDDGIATHVTPTMAARVPLKYKGPVTSPYLPAAGACEEFMLPDDPRGAFFMNARFVIVMRATTAEIMSDEMTPLLLDADFAGTSLSTTQLDTLWALTAPAAMDAAFLAALAPTGAPFPTGDGTTGGQYSSVFAVAKE